MFFFKFTFTIIRTHNPRMNKMDATDHAKEFCDLVLDLVPLNLFRLKRSLCLAISLISLCIIGQKVGITLTKRFPTILLKLLVAIVTKSNEQLLLHRALVSGDYRVVRETIGANLVFYSAPVE